MIRRIKPLVSLIRYLRGVVGFTPAVLTLRRQKRRTPSIIRQYLSNSFSEKKLHIGCQHHIITEWLNVDIRPSLSDVAYLDATKTFPLPSDSFDCVFSEHMIEHINLEQGVHMLRECNRVLKPGGRIRLVTPDIALLQNLLMDPGRADHAAYIEFSRRYFTNPIVFNEVVVVNNFFRDWGHQFIYNEATLGGLLQMAGFRDIVRVQVGVSQDPILNGLENHHLEITDRFNQMESLVMEAVK